MDRVAPVSYTYRLLEQWLSHLHGILAFTEAAGGFYATVTDMGAITSAQADQVRRVRQQSRKPTAKPLWKLWRRPADYPSLLSDSLRRQLEAAGRADLVVP